VNSKKEVGMFEVVIVSPHTDDEIIGVSSVLLNPKMNPIIIYTEDVEQERRLEAIKIKEFVEVKAQLFLKSIPTNLLDPKNTFYFPDPVYELHPAHRLQGAIGEQLVRSGLDVIFYSTNMQAPYCHEVDNPDAKEDLLNKVYPSQKDLWKYEKKYILFEGKCRWII